MLTTNNKVCSLFMFMGISVPNFPPESPEAMSQRFSIERNHYDTHFYFYYFIILDYILCDLKFMTLI